MNDPAVASRAEPRRPEQKSWQVRLLERLNPWYVIMFVSLFAVYIYLRYRTLQNLVGTDTTLTVHRVIDGDSFFATTRDGVVSRFRLRQFDAPELDQEYGLEARERLEQLLIHPDREVIALIWDQDSYGRCIVDVLTRDSVYTDITFVQKQMLSEGLGWAWGGFEQGTSLHRAMEEAKSKKIGLWNSQSHTEPWLHRNRQRKSEGPKKKHGPR